MSTDRVEWRVRFYQSNYNANKDKCFVRILRRGTWTLDGLVALACEGGGCGLEPETLKAAASVLIRQAREQLMEGFSIRTDLGTLTPSVKGEWSFNRTNPEERARNKATVRYTMSPQLKKAMAKPLFKLVNAYGFGISISSVKDMKTDTMDERLTRGGGLLIKGTMLLMNGDLPERGVYFVDAVTGEVAAHVEAEQVEVFKRTLIMVMVPEDLPDGWYLIRVVSQCTTSNRPMKQPGEYTFSTPMAVGEVEPLNLPVPEEEEEEETAND